jgi:hypothetical protein
MTRDGADGAIIGAALKDDDGHFTPVNPTRAKAFHAKHPATFGHHDL